MQYQTGEMPDTKILWSPRVAMNWDVAGDQQHAGARRHRRCSPARPLYVWISNQLGNTGVLHRRDLVLAPTRDQRLPVQPGSDRYKPTERRPAQGAASLRAERHRSGLQVPAGLAHQHRRRPPAARRHHQHDEFLYSKDVNGIYYINANLPAAQSAFTGVDTRPRWIGTPCATGGNTGGCVTRINNEPGNVDRRDTC